MSYLSRPVHYNQLKNKFQKSLIRVYLYTKIIINFTTYQQLFQVSFLYCFNFPRDELSNISKNRLGQTKYLFIWIGHETRKTIRPKRCVKVNKSNSTFGFPNVYEHRLTDTCASVDDFSQRRGIRCLLLLYAMAYANKIDKVIY